MPDDDVYDPQETLPTRTRTEHTDIHNGHPTPIRTHAHLRFRCTAGPAVQRFHLRRKGLWGCVGQRLRHVARPARTCRHATGRARLSPQHPARTLKHHHERVLRASPQKAKIQEKVCPCGMTVAGLSHEASDTSIVTRSDRRFTRGGRGSVAGQWLSQYIRVCGGGRVVIARNNSRMVA